MNLADALIPRTFLHDEVIVKQGDPADGMYFIEMGTVIVSMIGNDGPEKIVSKLLKNNQMHSFTSSYNFYFR